jgi:tetratricopeptide (TPR) repeat protein
MAQTYALAVAAAYHRQGKLREAEALYREWLAADPNCAEGYNDLGNVLCDAGRAEEAIPLYRQAIAINSNYVPAYNNLGTALRDRGRVEEAVDAYHSALRSSRNIPEVFNNLGVALTELGRLDEALSAYRRAIGMRSDYADAHSNFGIALYARGDAAGAVSACSKAVELDPDSTKARSNLSLILLGAGDFARGWREHEWRFKCNPMFVVRPFEQPQWKGEAPTGRTIFLHAEQGLGDTIQFARFVPEVARRGARLVLECQGELLRLLEDLPGLNRIIPRGAALPHFDLHCPLMSLPLALSTTLETIPPPPYLAARSDLRSIWAGRLGQKKRVRVGLAWAGRTTHSNDANRSMRFDQMAPLLGIEGIEFHSLQHGSGALPASGGSRIADHRDHLTDFAETAGLVAHLDLVICVDTAVAHLAGAMGKPTWVLLPYAAEWRWMIGREDSPWYPGMRLFRQQMWGDWAGVIARVRDALSKGLEFTM